jgi:hypothetical protein
MLDQNLQNRVVMMPDSLTGDTKMSHSPSPTQLLIPPESLSELELAVRLGLCLRAMLNHRKSGKLPAHFYVPTLRGSKQQVRYLLSDVENFEQAKQKPKPQK